MSESPFTLQIDADLWAWTWQDARHLTDQITEAFEQIRSANLAGGVLDHQRLTSVTLTRRPERKETP